ncbi:MAG: RdgB/HAM1 family non-canonical purine NTP pyrophosphatase [Proteobacteria bacterium]|nr:RdgB/HAM1 family non-canonical purine NTP pyrophosphatase [Pseudomonadota bacterium]
MQSLVLATGNAGKQRELAALLQGRGLQLLRQTELGVTSVEETGTTFEANALLKARHAAAATGLPALADDSGLEVDALGGAPGVYSARYAGEHAGDAANTALLLQRLQGVEFAARTARFRCVIVLVRDANDAAPLIASGCWEGHIALAPAGDGGFGYDPVFVPQGGALTISQLDEVAKNQASHRGQALQSLLARWPGSLR